MHCISWNTGRYIQNENKEGKQRKQKMYVDQIQKYKEDTYLE